MIFVFNFQEGEYKAVPTSQTEPRQNGTDEILTVSSSFSSQPVTYSWENMTVFHETTPGNCLTRLCKKSPPIQKKILDNGNVTKINKSIVRILTNIVVELKSYGCCPSWRISGHHGSKWCWENHFA